MARICYVIISCLLLLLPLESCQNQKIAIAPTTQQPTLTIFKNQTGNAGAEALQAQWVDPIKKYTVSIYGAFNADNTPKTVQSLTLQKMGNDTTVHFVLNALTRQLETIYMDVKGAKQALVLKASFVPNDLNSVRLGLYAYNWQTNTGVLKSEVLYRRTSGTTTATPLFAARTASTWLGDALGILTTSVGMVEIGLAATGATPLLLTPAVLAAAGGAAIALGTFALHVAILAVAVDTIFNQAGAAEPSSLPYPSGTSPQHTSLVPAPATLPTSSCDGVSIRFSVSMDSFGSILFSAVTGGVGPYTYAIDGRGFQQNPVFSNGYPDGSYLVAVRSATGCIGAAVIPLKRKLECLPAAQLQLLTDGNTKTWRVLSVVIYSPAGSTAYTIAPNFIPTYVFTAAGAFNVNWVATTRQGGSNIPMMSPDNSYGTMNFCRFTTAEDIRLYNNGNWRIVTLTATSLVLRYDSPSGNYEIQTLAPL